MQPWCVNSMTIVWLGLKKAPVKLKVNTGPFQWHCGFPPFKTDCHPYRGSGTVFAVFIFSTANFPFILHASPKSECLIWSKCCLLRLTLWHESGSIWNWKINFTTWALQYTTLGNYFNLDHLIDCENGNGEKNGLCKNFPINTVLYILVWRTITCKYRSIYFYFWINKLYKYCRYNFISCSKYITDLNTKYVIYMIHSEVLLAGGWASFRNIIKDLSTNYQIIVNLPEKQNWYIYFYI